MATCPARAGHGCTDWCFWRSYKKHIKALITPLGIIPYDDHNSIGSVFNFWMGHTNFDLTPKIVSIIENSEGVELLDVYTRYRFRVGIGQLFNAGDVMSGINTNVYRCLDDGNE
ncbi:MAG: hypothetical protein EB127_22390 [Alphaproteobacteria bacterium]|nr:hypothetical protein [Alphaproteobacteria bacterium]